MIYTHFLEEYEKTVTTDKYGISHETLTLTYRFWAYLEKLNKEVIKERYGVEVPEGYSFISKHQPAVGNVVKIDDDNYNVTLVKPVYRRVKILSHYEGLLGK